MGVKYFCDICNKEVNLGSRIHIMGAKSELNTLCNECWSKAEGLLLSSDSTSQEVSLK